ncbi:MAG: SufS family cysteine desulfurase, partial [Isosphaeraceae bacterium]
MSTSLTKIAPGPGVRDSPVTALNLALIRRDFPALNQQIHGHPLIYLDNAASTQKPRAVLDAITHYYEADNANVHRGVHAMSDRATAQFEQARERVRRFLNARELHEIILVRGATEAINLVAQTFGRQNVGPGDEVVVTWMEHHANIVPWQMLCEEKGAKLRVVPITDDGDLRLDVLESLLTPRTKLLAVTHVSNVLGAVNPIKTIIDLAHRHGVPVLVDGAQAVSHLAVNVQELDCDFYAFSGHKIYAPMGIGVLYGKTDLLEAMPPWQGGGDMIKDVTFEATTFNELPHKFEAGTPNVAGAVGLSAALEYLKRLGLPAVAEHEHKLLETAILRLKAIPGVRIVGSPMERTGAVSFVVEDPPLSALDVGSRLDLQGIAVRTGHHCCQPLLQRLGLPGTIRASFGVYNTMDEVETFADALALILIHACAERTRAAAAPKQVNQAAYPSPMADSVAQAAEEVAEELEWLSDWADRYEFLIELGEQLPEMPAELKTEANRVRGCQSTVFLSVRTHPGTLDVVEFLADSDAKIVQGLLSLLQHLFSGQRAAE